MEHLKFKFIIAYALVISSMSHIAPQLVKLEGSSPHNNNNKGLVQIGNLDSSIELTVTIVTGSLENTRLVASYYSGLDGLSVFGETEIHLKLSGSVESLSNAFDTTFIEYECGGQRGQSKVCFCTNTDISIPATLKSAIIGVLGLENILTMNPN
jgi:hypothetical protein